MHKNLIILIIDDIIIDFVLTFRNKFLYIFNFFTFNINLRTIEILTMTSRSCLEHDCPNLIEQNIWIQKQNKLYIPGCARHMEDAQMER